MRFIVDVLRSLIRIIALLIGLSGLAALGFLAAVLLRTGEGLPEQPLGQVWFQNDPFAFLNMGPSIQLVQVFFERKLMLPELWNPGITTILNWPAWAGLLSVGAALLVTAGILFRLTRRR